MGPPVAAQISWRNSAGGVSGGVLANANGVYFIADLEPGGPYEIEAAFWDTAAPSCFPAMPQAP